MMRQWLLNGGVIFNVCLCAACQVDVVWMQVGHEARAVIGVCSSANATSLSRHASRAAAAAAAVLMSAAIVTMAARLPA